MAARRHARSWSSRFPSAPLARYENSDSSATYDARPSGCSLPKWPSGNHGSGSRWPNSDLAVRQRRRFANPLVENPLTDPGNRWPRGATHGAGRRGSLRRHSRGTKTATRAPPTTRGQAAVRCRSGHLGTTARGLGGPTQILRFVSVGGSPTRSSRTRSLIPVTDGRAAPRTELVVEVPFGATREVRKQRLERHLRREAKRLFAAEVAIWEPRLGVSVAQL